MATRQGSGAASSEPVDDDGYPGQAFGYPESGPGSIAGFGSRMLALAIDWALSMLIAGGVLGFRLASGQGAGESFKPLVVFLVMSVVLVGTAGSTIGHTLLGLRVTRINGGYAGPLAALIRQGLLCLAIPALIWDGDERGLHDRAARTVLRRTR